MQKSIRFNLPYISGKEHEYIKRVFEENKFSGNNNFSKKCHKFIETNLQTNKALLTTSCTAALELSALLLNLEEGDEIILPSYTFCSTASAYCRSGVKPIFCEINESNLMVDIQDIESKITSKTKAIIPVHYGGSAADISSLKKIAKERNISIIEDAAQGFGSKDKNGQYLGTIGDIGCFSFHETKNIHCGLGGAVLINTHNLEQIEAAVEIWERGTNRQKKIEGLVDKYTWTRLGSSFYPTELQAAFLYAQLETYKDNILGRKRLYEVYLEELSPLEGQENINFLKHDNEHNHHAMIILVENDRVNSDLRQFLVDKKIESYIGYVPLHSSPMGKKYGYRSSDLPITESLSKRVIRLPMHNYLTEDDILYICNSVKEYYQSFEK